MGNKSSNWETQSYVCGGRDIYGSRARSQRDCDEKGTRKVGGKIRQTIAHSPKNKTWKMHPVHTCIYIILAGIPGNDSLTPSRLFGTGNCARWLNVNGLLQDRDTAAAWTWSVDSSLDRSSTLIGPGWGGAKGRARTECYQLRRDRSAIVAGN